jgi:hypothetical protein
MRKKGTPKTGGRTKGTPNKVTGTLKEFVANLIDQNREQMERDLKSLSPRDRLYALDKLMQYILPKNSSQSLDVKENSFEKLMGSLPDDPYELER